MTGQGGAGRIGHESVLRSALRSMKPPVPRRRQALRDAVVRLGFWWSMSAHCYASIMTRSMQSAYFEKRQGRGLRHGPCRRCVLPSRITNQVVGVHAANAGGHIPSRSCRERGLAGGRSRSWFDHGHTSCAFAASAGNRADRNSGVPLACGRQSHPAHDSPVASSSSSIERTSRQQS